MISKGTIRLSRTLERSLKTRIERYDFEVGVLQDKPHRDALPKEDGHRSYAGIKVRRTAKTSSKTVAQVSMDVRKSTGVNYLIRPWQSVTDDARRLADNFLQMVFDPNPASKHKRLINLIQAVVRNPILRGDYGPNTKGTVTRKGFNKKLVDTAQLFQNIRARINFRRGS